jgi:hypothetical protein
MQQFTISASWQLSGTPLEKNLYRASDATMNSRTSLLIRKGTFLPLNGLCGHGIMDATFHRDGPLSPRVVQFSPDRCHRLNWP